MGEIKIEIRGVEARLVNGQWLCDDKDMARRLRVATKTALKPGEYYPDPDLAIAENITKAYLGKITHVDPLHRPTDHGQVY